MNNEILIFDSARTAFNPIPATWEAYCIDVKNPATKSVSYHIYWRDVAITFYLRQTNFYPFIFAMSTVPYDDFTVAYRVIDPAWVDPVVGDPYTSHIVSFQNQEGKYVTIGYSARVLGAAPVLKIAQVIERYPG